MADSDSEVQFNFERARPETTVDEDQPETVRPKYTVVDKSDEDDEPDETDREAMDHTREYDTTERDDSPAQSTPVAARGDGEDVRVVRRKEVPREEVTARGRQRDLGRGDFPRRYGSDERRSLESSSRTKGTTRTGPTKSIW